MLPLAEFFTKDGLEVTLPFGGLHGRGVMKQDPPMVWDLHVSLEDLFFGCTKKMKISHRVRTVRELVPGRVRTPSPHHITLPRVHSARPGAVLTAEVPLLYPQAHPPCR